MKTLNNEKSAINHPTRREAIRLIGLGAVGGTLASALPQSAAAAQTGPAAQTGTTGKGRTPPNILFIMCDELRFPSTFPSGISTPEEWFAKFMPNVYGLWQKGVKFTSHYTAGNACTPARGTLLTGLYALQTWFCETMTQKNEDPGTRGAQPQLNPAFPTWGKLLREQGYRTAWAGKWHASYADGLQQYGWDEQLVTPDPTGYNLQGTYGDEKDGYRNDQDIENAATGWLSKQATSSQPWALTASFVNPHDYQSYWAGTEFKTYNDLFDKQSTYTPITYYSKNEGTDYPPVVSWSEDKAKDPPSYGYPETPANWESAAEMAENKPSTQLLWRTFGGATWGAASDDSNETEFSLSAYPNQPSNSSTNTGIGYAPFSYWQRGLDAYTWFCGQVDKHVGNVVSALPKEVEDNTIIVFTADHGEFAGAHGMLAGKIGTNYDEAFHIPLIVVDNTGRYATDVGTERTGLTSSVDMLRFLVSLPSGGTGWMTGDLLSLYSHRADMLAMLKSADAPGRPYVVFTNDEGIPGYYNANDRPLHITGLRTAKWKLGSYARWLPGTTTVDPGSIELEYYDYSTTSGQEELDSTPNTPAAAAANNFLHSVVVPNELQAPMPASLIPAQAEAQRALIDYFTLLAAAVYPPDAKQFGFGADF